MHCHQMEAYVLVSNLIEFVTVRLYLYLIHLDIDECQGAAREENVCADQTTTCRNTNGSYECDCIPGYVKSDDPVHHAAQIIILQLMSIGVF